MKLPWRVLPWLAALCAPAGALAQSEIELSGNAAVVSDYRDRGVSLSDRGPALQAGADLEAGAFFAGTWASTIAETGGAEIELDLYAGLQGELGETAVSAGAYAYLYPGGEGVNYVELFAQAERGIGPATLGIEAALAPRQKNVTEANRYLGLSAAIDAGRGFGVLAAGGYEDGFYVRKWHWELGATYSQGPFTASLAYVDTNRGADDEAGRAGRAGLIGSLAAEF